MSVRCPTSVGQNLPFPGRVIKEVKGAVTMQSIRRSDNVDYQAEWQRK